MYNESCRELENERQTNVPKEIIDIQAHTFEIVKTGQPDFCRDCENVP